MKNQTKNITFNTYRNHSSDDVMAEINLRTCSLEQRQDQATRLQAELTKTRRIIKTLNEERDVLVGILERR